MANWKGYFNTIYWAKYQRSAILFRISNLLVLYVCFVSKWLNMMIPITQEWQNLGDRFFWRPWTLSRVLKFKTCFYRVCWDFFADKWIWKKENRTNENLWKFLCLHYFLIFFLILSKFLLYNLVVMYLNFTKQLNFQVFLVFCTNFQRKL